jgi:hypothetical protein
MTMNSLISLHGFGVYTSVSQDLGPISS